MKEPLRIDRKMLLGMTCEPDERFVRDMERLIDQLPGKEDVVVKKKISTAAVVLFALLLLGATGLAIGLSIDEIWKQSFEKMNTRGMVYMISQPEDGDMSAEEAIEIAKDAIRSAYGTTDEEFARMGVYPTFFAHGWDEQAPDDPAEWRIRFSSRTDVDLDLDTLWWGPDGEYGVNINAETEEIMFINWYTNDFWAKAQRIWDCGNYDEVYRHYRKPSFYVLPRERQAYFEELLAQKGYELIRQNEKYHELLLKMTLDLQFADPDAAIAPGTDKQADAAWTALELHYGLDRSLLQKYAYQATRAELNTGTDDVCIAFNFEEEFRRIDTAVLDPWCDRLFSGVRRLGLFMVSFVPGTTQLVQITHIPFSEVQNCESIPDGRLLEKTDWTARELYLFDEAYIELENAIARLIHAGASENEKRLVTHAYMRSLGGDPDIYEEAPQEYDLGRWFDGEAAENPVTRIARQAYADYGPNTMFWPMEIQAQVLSNRTLDVPKPGEMTQREAAMKAKKAVMDQYGEDALPSLGRAYFMGYELYRLEPGGCSRWHVYITDDPVKMENGWQVVFVDVRCEMHEESLEVRDIKDDGNG